MIDINPMMTQFSCHAGEKTMLLYGSTTMSRESRIEHTHEHQNAVSQPHWGLHGPPSPIPLSGAPALVPVPERLFVTLILPRSTQ